MGLVFTFSFHEAGRERNRAVTFAMCLHQPGPALSGGLWILTRRLVGAGRERSSCDPPPLAWILSEAMDKGQT